MKKILINFIVLSIFSLSAMDSGSDLMHWQDVIFPDLEPPFQASAPERLLLFRKQETNKRHEQENLRPDFERLSNSLKKSFTESSLWKPMKEKLLKLGMIEEDLDKKIPKDYSLGKLKLTNFWKEKETVPQEEKNELLATMLDFSYPEFYNLQRMHIASAVMIGANVNTKNNSKICDGPALSTACIQNDIQLVTFLLQHNADSNVKVTIMPLEHAYYDKNEKLALLLLRYGAAPERHFGDYQREGLVWCQKIQQQMQKEQEEGLKFLSAKAALNKWPSIDKIKKFPIKLPTELYDYLEETKKMLN